MKESKIDCVEKTNKIQALRFAKDKFETEVASTQKDLEEKKVECIEKNSKIQTLEISEIKLKTEIPNGRFLSFLDILNSAKSMEREACSDDIYMQSV